MFDAVVFPPRPATWWRQLAARLKRSLDRAGMARATRRALSELPDNVLNDIGVSRGAIDFIAEAFAARKERPNSGKCARRLRGDCRAARPLSLTVLRAAFAIAVAGSVYMLSGGALRAQDAQVKRGEYLVNLGGCNDCHTPGYFFGKPDPARFLGGSEVGFEIPTLGVFHGPNLTPDKETGLGTWSTQDIVTAITRGRRPDGRVLAPIMPWHAFAKLTDQDVRAIAAFLKSVPPVRNKVPGPFGPGETPTSFVMKIAPPPAATVGAASK